MFHTEPQRHREILKMVNQNLLPSVTPCLCVTHLLHPPSPPSICPKRLSDPQADQRLPIWEVLHQLIRVFNTDGETGAAAVFAAVQSKAEAARQLAYRLYTLCERKNWAEDARAYNEVVTSWSGIESAAAKEPAFKQGKLF